MTHCAHGLQTNSPLGYSVSPAGGGPNWSMKPEGLGASAQLLFPCPVNGAPQPEDQDRLPSPDPFSVRTGSICNGVREQYVERGRFAIRGEASPFSEPLRREISQAASRRWKNDRYRWRATRRSSVDTSSPRSHCCSRSARSKAKLTASRCMTSATSWSAAWTDFPGSSTKEPWMSVLRTGQPLDGDTPTGRCRSAQRFFARPAHPARHDDVALHSHKLIARFCLRQLPPPSSASLKRLASGTVRQRPRPARSVGPDR